MEDLQFHQQSVLINSIMQTPGWEAFIKSLEARKAATIMRQQRSETDIEVAAVEKKGDNVTIVVINKDYLKHELDFILRLEGQFKEWAIEAAKNVVKGEVNE